MIEWEKLLGKSIEFHSAKYGTVVGKLIGHGRDNIQIELQKELQTSTRMYFPGDRRLFDIDKITDVEQINAPERKREPQERRRKPKLVRQHNMTTRKPGQYILHKYKANSKNDLI